MKYEAGMRVKLIFMDDYCSPPEGTLGTITSIDSIGQIHVDWDNGSTLALIEDVDKFEIV